ncbi:MAG: IS110 family transposase [Candidatus Scalindua sp.]|jgi:transposase|nr:IS110 family transposase [Candidatus Scalindua sp.]
MKGYNVDNFATLIGVDWADTKHDICEHPANTNDYQYSVIKNNPESLHDWAMDLKTRYPNQQIAVACELKKGPLIYALTKYSHITIFTINPSTVAKYRKAFTPSGAKDDPSDAYTQVEILSLHMSKLTVIEPEPASIRSLTQLVEYRRSVVQDGVDLTNKITATLKNYYPQVLEWFDEKDTLIFCDFITKWPSLSLVKRARKQTLLDFFTQHNSRYADTNEARIAKIKAAMPLTEDQGVIEPNQMLIEVFIPQLRVLLQGVAKLNKAIKLAYKRQNDRAIFDSLPGAGPQLAPRLLVAFGSNRDRYSEAAELQKYAGIAPVIERSGKKKWTHWRYSCPTFLRQTFVEWAGFSIRYSFWAKAYYDQQKAKGKPHNTIIRSLAFKWIRIAFRCWKTSTPYDESKYLEALKRRGSPLLKFAINS